MYVCICNAVTDHEIRAAVSLGARTFEDLRDTLGVATGCGRCTDCAKGVLAEALAAQPAVQGVPATRAPHARDEPRVIIPIAVAELEPERLAA